METRINPITNKLERKLQPPGLPPLWVSVGYCDKCQPFGECLGLSEFSDEDMVKIESEIKNALDYSKAKEMIDEKFNLKTCNLLKN